MILTWTPEFLETALSTLTEQQRSAIHLAADASEKTPGPVRVKKAGFESVTQYLEALDAARTKLKTWFATWDITRVADLDFLEVGCSSEGRIQRAAKAGKRRS